MLCYKDRTWCVWYEQCVSGKRCDAALTPKVREQAEEWWVASGGEPGEAPLSLTEGVAMCFIGKASRRTKKSETR